MTPVQPRVAGVLWPRPPTFTWAANLGGEGEEGRVRGSGPTFHCKEMQFKIRRDLYRHLWFWPRFLKGRRQPALRAPGDRGALPGAGGR